MHTIPTAIINNEMRKEEFIKQLSRHNKIEITHGINRVVAGSCVKKYNPRNKKLHTMLWSSWKKADKLALNKPVAVIGRNEKVDFYFIKAGSR